MNSRAPNGRDRFDRPVIGLVFGNQRPVMGRIKDAASGEDRVGIVDARFVGSIPGLRGQVFLQVVQFQQQRIIETLVRHLRRDELRVLAPQRYA